jgi:2,4-dienoyl-CoA reductase-like NADH-dependent reductase (Old Yellow Enzyme family)
MEKIPAVGPSVITSYLTGSPSRELAGDELPGIVEQYASAVRRVREAGYDGIELHAAHGYMLLGSFLSPWRNKRGDDYAGRKRDARMRLLLEVLARSGARSATTSRSRCASRATSARRAGARSTTRRGSRRAWSRRASTRSTCRAA